jgi:hypothetical protein
VRIPNFDGSCMVGDCGDINFGLVETDEDIIYVLSVINYIVCFKPLPQNIED